MDDQLGQIFVQLMRKSTKYTWVFLSYGIFVMGLIFGVLFQGEGFSQWLGVESKFDILVMLAQNFLVSMVLFVVFKLFSESSQSLVTRRHEFYNLAMSRINKIFEGRYQGYNGKGAIEYGEFKDIILYPSMYERAGENHSLDFDRFNFKIIDDLDTMYICYSINENEKFYLSVWHAGNFLAIGILLDKKLFDRVRCTEDDFVAAFKRGLNIKDASNYDSLDFVPRGEFLMFDIKYDTDEMFLKDIVKQDEMSRKIAHIASVGIPLMMNVLDWEIKNSDVKLINREVGVA